MRKKIIIISILSTLWLYGRAQGYYYDAWFDNNLSTMTHGTEPFGENELTLDLSALTSPGLHFLNIIPYYEWGEMGVWKCIPFVMPEGWPGDLEPGSIEYWVTGYDSKPKTKPYGDEATALDIDISGMSCGLHFLNYRVFTKSGYPSPWKIIPFYLSNDTFGKEEMQYEYWIDDEETHKTGAGIMPGALDLIIDPSSLSDGEHTFHFKAGNLIGGYGEEFSTKFYVLKGQLSLIKNPNIVATSKTNIPNWTCTRTAQNGNTKDASGDTFFEVWNPTAASILFDYYQDIELTNGVYRLESSVFNSTNDVSGATVNKAVGLYAQTNQHEWFAPVGKDSGIEDADLSVADGIVVTDGHLRVGVRNRNVMSARWAGADDFLLTYLGTTQEVFGKSEEDALIYSEGKQIGTWPANPDGSRDASILIFNSDANSALTTGWTTSNVKTLNGEAWDGDNANYYFDFNKTSAYTSSLEQELKLLPAGDYTLSLMMRCAEGAHMTVTATSGSNQVSKTYTGIGNVSPSYSHFEKGWQLFTLPAVSVASGGSLKIQMTASMAANQWWSADDFKLTWSGTTPVIDDGSILRGDANGDGEIGMPDVMFIVNYILGTPAATFKAEAADVNGDGEIGMPDVMFIVQYILNGKFPDTQPDQEQGNLTCPDDNHPHVIDLGLPSGTKWACCNVGADDPHDFGGYFSWGETTTKDYVEWDTYKYGRAYNDCDYIGSDIAGTMYDAATTNWGSLWQMPNKAQLQELIDNTTSQWTWENGANGRLFTGKNGGTLFLPAAGIGDEDYIGNVGWCGYYWSSTYHERIESYAYILQLDSDEVTCYGNTRVSARSIRPVRK